MQKRLSACLIAIVISVGLLPGCDAVSRHKFVTTLFDGYPSLPPAEEYCAQYAEVQVKAQQASSQQAVVAEEAGGLKKPTKHEPYAAKACNDCHDKNKENGLILPPRKLCFHCHEDFIQGSQVHGPVAVGDCLACHLPHSASYPSLLKASSAEICANCHQENRLAAGLHARVQQKSLICIDCHDPHFSNAQYLLK